MLKAIEAQKRTPDWFKQEGQFIPYPATWLNGKRWEDCISEVPNFDSKKSDDAMRKMWKGLGLSTCHGKKLIDGKEGRKHCEQCLSEQEWARIKSEPVKI